MLNFCYYDNLILITFFSLFLDFVDDNPFIEMLEINYVNDTKIISRNPKMTAINSCIEVDLTGQVCSDSIGTRMYSGKVVTPLHQQAYKILLIF